jgi:hypothetical protein
MKISMISCLVGVLVPSLADAQLSGTVGPSTTTAYKAGLKICNILNYGGSASATFDNGPAILAAWTACKTGGQGEYFCFNEIAFLIMRSIHPFGGLWNGHCKFKSSYMPSFKKILFTMMHTVW